jgi:LytS/YehU family sensor histidine kinase
MPEHLKFPLIAMSTRSFFWIIFLNAVGTIYLIQKRLQKRELYHQKLEKDKINTELKLLKAQINPHFLFNALNNIFSLSYMKSDKAPESVLKLSGMLRYVIEDCVHETVPIQKEIEYIKNYLAFQMMKSPEEMNINFHSGEINNTLQIAPLLLIPFIENSFKYSKIEEFPAAYIDIRIGTEEKNRIWFSISNSVPPAAKAPSGSGLGIENVKQRLKLIYPNKHSIQIEEKENTFEVTINIELS